MPLDLKALREGDQAKRKTYGKMLRTMTAACRAALNPPKEPTPRIMDAFKKDEPKGKRAKGTRGMLPSERKFF